MFPPAAIPLLGLLSQVGVILFMFLVGLHLDTGQLRQRRHAVVAISHASIVLPFVLGSALALVLYPRLSARDVPFATFALFLGVAMSITAFPVLARILRDRGIDRTPIGALAISCAAVDDVTAWCLLALVVGVAREQATAALVTALLALAYVALDAGRRGAPGPPRGPSLRALRRRGRGAVALLLIGLVASALATEAMGIHALFGAFFLGALVPAESKLAQAMAGRMEDVVVVLLLPAFFAVTGLRTELGLLGSLGAVADVPGHRRRGLPGQDRRRAAGRALDRAPWREAAGLGALMNTRGLMELVVLNVGLDLGLISPALFSMMVLMAVFTTLITAPLLSLLKLTRGEPRE